MSGADFARAASEATVFGRITPEEKERMVGAVRAQGHYLVIGLMSVGWVYLLRLAWKEQVFDRLFGDELRT